MPKTLNYKSPRKGGIRPFIAIPAYAGINPAFAFALFKSQELLVEEGIHCDLQFMTEHCHVDDARNTLVRNYLETDCDRFVFIDADVHWEPEDLIRLIKYDKDIVAGIYPMKEQAENYPVRMLPGEVISVDGLIEVETVPTGFLKINRCVLEELAEKSTGFREKNDPPKARKIPIIFERSVDNDLRWSGDYTFCRKAAAEGYKIYVDPEMKFSHFGDNAWNGCLGDFLRKESNIINPKIVELLKNLRDGNYESETFVRLYEEWGNHWSATSLFYMTAFEVAKEHENIFECGSGMTTLLMGALGKKVTSFEDDYVWYKQVKQYLDALGFDTVNLVYAPIRNYGDFAWYSELPPHFDMAIVDGPERAIGREGFYKLADYRDATLLVDDCTDSTLYGRDMLVFKYTHPFAVSKPLKKAA